MPEWVNSQMRRSVLRRAPVNPLDRCTIVSIYPRKIDEKKPVWPERFIIPPGSIDEPALLHVEPASCWREVDIDQPLIEIPISSLQIAHSVVHDYCVGIFEVNMGVAQPGIFYVPGLHNLESIFKNFAKEFENAAVMQATWYKKLIAEADSLWARTQGNPLAISLDMKMAAEHFQMREKPWMKDTYTMELTACPGCGTLRNPNFPICQHCKLVIDHEKFNALGMKFAS